jgi:stage IV sporulation protein FB
VNKSHFRLFGTPVRVEPLFLVIAAVMGYQLRPLWVVFAWIAIVFVNVLVHEMGHALMFRVAKQRSAVVLHAFGGFTVPTGGGRRQMSKGMSIAVSLAGVGSQMLFLWLPARLLLNTQWAEDQPPWTQLLSEFSWRPVLILTAFVALWWSVLNILPIRPFDGGHVAEELLGFEMACKLSIGTAAVAAIVAAVQFSLFTGIFLALFAFLNYRELQEGRSTGSFDVDAPEAPPPGARGGQTTRKRSRSGHLQAVPPIPDVPADLLGPRDSGEVEQRVWNALRSGDADRAAAVLKQSMGAQPNPFVQASVALAQGHSALAVDLFEAAYMAEPTGPPNLVPAQLLAESEAAGALASALVAKGPVGIEAAGSLQTHLHYAERFQDAAEVGEQVFAAGPRSPAQTAFEVACSWARAGRAEEALRWVEAAVDAGFKAPGLLDGEPDLAPVRALDGWSAVRSRLTA